MDCECINMAKKAQHLYSLSLKYEKRIPASIVRFSMDVCNKYTKAAKEKKVIMDESELIKNILKEL